MADGMQSPQLGGTQIDDAFTFDAMSPVQIENGQFSARCSGLSERESSSPIRAGWRSSELSSVVRMRREKRRRVHQLLRDLNENLIDLALSAGYLVRDSRKEEPFPSLFFNI